MHCIWYLEYELCSKNIINFIDKLRIGSQLNLELQFYSNYRSLRRRVIKLWRLFINGQQKRRTRGTSVNGKLGYLIFYCHNNSIVVDMIGMSYWHMIKIARIGSLKWRKSTQRHTIFIYFFHFSISNF